MLFDALNINILATKITLLNYDLSGINITLE
jgi:hypothetical protein